MAIEFKFPDVGEGIHEGELKKWLVKEGDEVEEHQTIAEIETDKAVVEISSPVAGTILKLNAKEGEVVKVGQVLAMIGKKGEIAEIKKEVKKTETKAKSVSVIGELEEAPDEEREEEKEEVQKKEVEAKKEGTEIKAVPAARKKAKELGIDISLVKGTGISGVITIEDVEEFAKQNEDKVEQKPEGGVKAPKVSFEEWGSIIRLPLRGMRKTIAENMVRAERTAVHVTHMDEIDITELAKIREAKKTEAENKGFPLTFLPFVIKACVIALKEHPFVNSSLADETNEIILKKYYNVGIAVDTPNGLMVPVIKNCDKKSILEIAKDIFRLAEEARTREIQIKDLRGGTFTITNIGSLGGVYATPIINHPEIAILGLGRGKDAPVIQNEQIVVRKILPISLSFDHRVIDGAEAAKFVNDVKKHLEDPSLMLIDE